MKRTLSRREFTRKTGLFTAGLATVALPLRAANKGPNDKVVVGIIGCNGRGMDHIKGYLSVQNVEIAYICDVDSRAMEKGVAAVAAKQQKKPQGVTDLRRILDDQGVDAVSIATPDHWHAPAAILACAAGKHVYVEKPGSHNPAESQLMIKAARKYERHVQMGNQRRSWPWVIEAMESLHGGELGKLFFARAWYTNHRGSIGRGKVTAPPAWLDYSLWQGPAPERPFHDNVIHYNWHWFWHWGTGELGNNGVHALDLARWGLQVGSPLKATCGGNRYHFQDDWETPDIYVATFDFGDKGISWEGQSCDPRGFEGEKFGVSFFGEKGSLVLAGNNASLYDLNDKLLRQIKGKHDDVLHFANFIASIRAGEKLRSEIEEGQKSTMLCHLGNIAWRTGKTLKLAPASGEIVDTPEAAAFWSRSYRPGWEPKV